MSLDHSYTACWNEPNPPFSFAEYHLTWTTRPMLSYLSNPRKDRMYWYGKKSTSPTCPPISFRWWLHYLPHTGLGWHHFFVRIQDSQRAVCRRTSKPLGLFFMLSRRVFLNQHRERMLLSQAFYLTKHAGVTSGSWRAHAGSSQSCPARKRRLLFRSETLSAFDVIAMKEWEKNRSSVSVEFDPLIPRT